MLKVPTAHERIEMLARHIERPAIHFDVNYPATCFWGHATRLFGSVMSPQRPEERHSDYLARALGIDRDAAMRLYYGYPHDMPMASNKVGPIRTREQAARALRDLVAVGVSA